MLLVENIQVSEIMTPDLISVYKSDTMDKVHKIFNEHQIHHVLVVDNTGKLAGVISKGGYNLLCERFTLLKPEKTEMTNLHFFKSLRAEEVMRSQLAVLKPSDPISKAVGYFKENIFRAMPIIDEEHNLVGILTTYDLLVFAYKDLV